MEECINKKIAVKCSYCKRIRYVGIAQYLNIQQNKNKGRCRKCSLGLENLKKGRGWNKGLSISGMSGHKQSEYQKAILRKRNIEDNPAKKLYVKEKMRLAKLGKRGNTFGKTWTVAPEKLKNFGKYRGEKHWNWKGGKTQSRDVFSNARLKKWKNIIFARDNFTCQFLNCQQRGGWLEPHHIKRKIDYPELAYDILNGITLCHKHHKLTFFKEKRYEKYFLEKVQNV